MGLNDDLLKRLSRRKPVNTFIFEPGKEITISELSVNGKFIEDRLKGRGFVDANNPVYINFEKDYKRGRYPFNLCDSLTGSTVELKRTDKKGVEKTEFITIYGQDVSIDRSQSNHEIVTNAETVYNLLDNKLLFTLLQIKPQMWQMLVCIIIGTVLGLMIPV